MKNNIKILRKERQLTQQQLAKLLGVSRQTIISIELGKYDPSLPLAFKISKILEKSIENIFIY
ncbi:MAG: helix-turn-helix transcriptional regulator [Thiohalomonadales bacterium]